MAELSEQLMHAVSSQNSEVQSLKLNAQNEQLNNMSRKLENTLFPVLHLIVKCKMLFDSAIRNDI